MTDSKPLCNNCGRKAHEPIEGLQVCLNCAVCVTSDGRPWANWRVRNWA